MMLPHLFTWDAHLCLPEALSLVAAQALLLARRFFNVWA